MTSSESAPENGKPIIPPLDFEDPPPLRQPIWKIVLVLFGLMAYILYRTLVNAAAPPSGADPERVENAVNALGATKLAYAALRDSQDSPKNRAVKRLLDQQEDAALDEWRKLGDGKTAYPSDARRLGILLFLFGKPGGMKVFERIPTLHPPPPEKGEKVKPPAVPLAQEVACWKAIYGPNQLSRARARVLRGTLAKLKLNWFEHLAAAALYKKAGMKSEERAVSQRAYAATQTLAALNLIQLGALLIGTAGMFLFCIPAFTRSRFLQGHRFRPAYPSNALLIAFVAYLATFVFGALPLRPLLPLLRSLPEDTKYHIQIGVTVTLYALIVLIVTAVLRRLLRNRMAFAGRLSTRAILARLGFHAHPLPLLILGGLFAFALSRPVVTAAAILSDQLFRSFPTPPNPVILWLVGLESPLDKILLLLETALFAPIIEEMTFRGLLYPALRARWGVAYGAAGSAALFALAHPTLPGGFLPIWALGVVLALTFEWRGSLLPNILLHGLHNAMIAFTLFATLSH